MPRSSKRETRERQVEFKALPKVFFIATEDAAYANTFFYWLLNEKLQIHLRYIKIYPNQEGRSDPDSVTKNAIENATADSFSAEIDELWFVLDHDRWPQLERVCGTIAKRPGLYIADCKPCFEIWFLLYQNNGAELALGCRNSEDCRKEMIRIYGFGKTKDCSRYQEKEFHLFDKAIEQAKSLDTDRESIIQRTNGTRIYRLLESIQASLKKY